MYDHVIITCGISIFAQSNSIGKWTRNNTTYFDFDRLNPLIKDDRDQDEVIDEWFNEMKVHFTEPSEDPEHISAEYSVLHAMRKTGKLEESSLRITLLHTDSIGGKAGALALKYLLEMDLGAEVLNVKLNPFDFHDKQSVNRDLAAFMKRISDLLDQSDASRTSFAPVGGYKLITAFGSIVAGIHGYPTAYINEDVQILHEIPPLPIQFPKEPDQALRNDIAALSQAGIMEKEEASAALLTFSMDYPHLFEQDEELLMPNPLGLFVFGKYLRLRERWDESG